MSRLPNLEDELVRAARRQDERRRAVRWRPIAVSSVLALSLSGAALAATGTPVPVISALGGRAPQPKDPAAARRVSLTARAYAFINRANAEVFAERPGCDPLAQNDHRGPNRALAIAPPRSTLALVAALRRPASDADMAAARGVDLRFLGGALYTRSVRRVTAAGGQHFLVAVTRRGSGIFRPRPGCLDAQHERLVRLLASQSPSFRSLTLTRFSFFRTGQENNLRAPTAPHDEIALVGPGGGAAEVRRFRTHGTFTSGNAAGEPVRVTGLVPDGVSRIEFVYPRTVSRGRDFKPTTYPSAFKRTIRVHDNVVVFEVPRPPEDGMPTQMVWKDARGRVLRVVRADR